MAGWGARQQLSQPEPQRGPSFYFPDFFLRDLHPWFVHEHTREFTIEELISLIGNAIPAPSSQKLQWETSGKDIFSETFHHLQLQFQAGILDKAVPYIFETAKSKMDQPLLGHMLLTLLQKAQLHPIHPYGFWDSKEGMVGGTPEALFRVEKTPSCYRLSTVACAGTAPVERAQLMLQDPKELHEHELVVKGISQSLNSFGKIIPGKCYVLSLPALAHLVTPITVDMPSNVPFDKIVEAMHPTPALGAFPKIPGIIWLKDYQTKVSRGRFGAPAGYYIPAKEEGGCYVAIRNVQWHGSEMKIGAGCGVVSQSQLEKEWAEIQLKLGSIKGLLQL